MLFRLRIEPLLRAGTVPPPLFNQPPRWHEPLMALIGGGLLYGAAMGTFGGFAGDRVWQIFYSALKVPMLLLVTLGLSLPGFCVLNTLAGLRPHLGRALTALLTSQAGAAVVLGALAPYPLLWYAGGTSYHAATLFNGVLFAVASIAGQLLLRRQYAPLIAADPRHRLMLRIWLAMYCFTGIQMAWVLRPFLGDPHVAVEFFREQSWGNAYVVVARLVWRAVFGR